MIKLVTDGGCGRNPGYMRIGVLILDENNKIIKKIHRKLGWGTNNQAEIKALMEGLHQLKELKLDAQPIAAYSDSEIMCNHFDGSFRIKNPELKELHKELKFLISDFSNFKLQWHPREAPLASMADAICNGVENIEHIFGIST